MVGNVGVHQTAKGFELWSHHQFEEKYLNRRKLMGDRLSSSKCNHYDHDEGKEKGRMTSLRVVFHFRLTKRSVLLIQ